MTAAQAEALLLDLAAGKVWFFSSRHQAAVQMLLVATAHAAGELAEGQDAIEGLLGEVAEKDEEIAEIQKELDEAEDDLAEAEDDLDEAEEDVEKLRAKLDHAELALGKAAEVLELA